MPILYKGHTKEFGGIVLEGLVGRGFMGQMFLVLLIIV